MRVGDVYKIARMVKDGQNDEAILNRFKNDYPAKEIDVFIKVAKDEAKVKKTVDTKAKKDSKKIDPLG